MEKEQKTNLNVNVKSFLVATIIIYCLMLITYILTFIIPGGEYVRIIEDGKTIVTNEYHSVEGGIPFWKWLLSPFLVLGSDNGSTLIAVVIFLFVIGGIFECLNKCGIMKYMLDKITHTFIHKRYLLMAIVILFFMAMGSLIGSFEEVVPLVPIVVAIAISLGFDNLTGFTMSLLAAGCGFAAGVFNPFTVGVAQELAGLPMFSGFLVRLLVFVIIYITLFTFTYLHAKRIEKPVEEIINNDHFIYDENKNKALIAFVIILFVGIVFVLSSALIPAFQDFTMVVVALAFLVSGVCACIISKMETKDFFKTFSKGAFALLPATFMILLASSIKFTLEEANILDSILHYLIGISNNLPTWAIVLFIYFVVLVMNFFVASGSAKAFMLIPLIVPLANMFGISSQVCVLAYAFGDGFSNVIYPTNPVLLIGLGVSDISYGKWFKHSIVFQLINLVITSIILVLAFYLGY